MNRIWNFLELPKTIAVKGRDGKLHDGVRMWKYWCLEEGTLGVDPNMHKMNDGRFPPVIHVDTDAPLYSDVDGKLITDKLWGLYYKPDFNFGGIQGGASPYKVEQDPDAVAVDPYGPESPDFIVGENFVEMWCSALAHCQKRFEGKIGQYKKHEKSGGLGCFTPDNFPVFDSFSRERLRDRRFQPRLQDDRSRQARRAGADGREERAARAVPLFALRKGRAASDVEQPVSVELRWVRAS